MENNEKHNEKHNEEHNEKWKWLSILSIKIIDVSPINVKTMKLAMKLWNHEITSNDLPPIKVQLNKQGIHQIKNGRHRYLAFRLCGITHIKAIISKPTHI